MKYLLLLFVCTFVCFCRYNCTVYRILPISITWLSRLVSCVFLPSYNCVKMTRDNLIFEANVNFNTFTPMASSNGSWQWTGVSDGARPAVGTAVARISPMCSPVQRLENYVLFHQCYRCITLLPESVVHQKCMCTI